MSTNKSFTALQTGVSRRQFIYSTALAASAIAFSGYGAPRPRRISANEKVNIAVIGLAGKGASDTDLCAGENIVALCDVDESSAAQVRSKYPKATFYKDFRKMLEQDKSIDAVIVATPDHLHATIAAMAMKMGKHVYCQKPLTYSVYEARTLRDMAKKYGVATQMGNQGSAEDGLRRAVEVIQAGLIGPVRQVYVWSNRPFWPQGIARPAGADTVPSDMDWDMWIGPAPMRPFKQGVYHPFNWRGWTDFGTGALGDMACHTCNMPFRALQLGYPTEVEAQSSAFNGETYPMESKIRFEFPARGNNPPLTFRWYDGGEPTPSGDKRPFHDGSNKPPTEVTTDIAELLDKVPPSGCLLVGDKGKLFSPDDYGARFFLKLNDEKEFKQGKDHGAVTAIPESIPRNAFTGNADARHHLEWIEACKGGKPGYSDFDIAAYLTEIILLGCVALKVGEKLEWDGPKMRATNTRKAAQYVRRKYRKGWEL